jgi:metal-sulfur cluster biosynthetic enzyme
MTRPVTQGGAAVRDAVIEALGRVLDPELDEPITDLGFVTACDIGASGGVRVRLRLPTYFCAPNFVFLMVADARDAVMGVPDVSEVEVVVEDHFAADDINAGVAEGRGFVDTFGHLAASELDQLRADFLRKAVLVATHRACQPLLDAGCSVGELAAKRLGEAHRGAEAERLRDRRMQLGLPAGANSPLVVDPVTGDPISGEAMGRHLGRARLTRVSVEANGEICRNLLRDRYGETLVSIGRRRISATGDTGCVAVAGGHSEN